MSIVSEIERIKTNIANAYTELENKGATIPIDKNSNNLLDTISSLQIVTDEIEELLTSYKSSIDDTLGANCTKIPDGITAIGGHAFRYCSFLALNGLSDEIIELGNLCFAYTNITLTKLPDKLKVIQNGALRNCTNLTFKEIPVGVTVLKGQILMGCTGLTEITCRGNITSIEAEVFSGDTNLTKFALPNITKVPTLANANAFNNTPIAKGTGYIYFPDGLVETAKGQTNWSNYANQIKGVSEL